MYLSKSTFRAYHSGRKEFVKMVANSSSESSDAARNVGSIGSLMTPNDHFRDCVRSFWERFGGHGKQH